MNVSIPPFKAKLQRKYLYDGDEAMTGLVDVTVIGIASYEKQPIVFHCLVDNQFLYSDLPITALTHTGEIDPSFTLKMLSHCLCATLVMEVFSLGFGRASVYFKDKDAWIGGSYMFSVDFTTGNELLHLMRLDNGLFAFVPNHKVNWAGKCALTDYKKNHSVWTF